LNRRLQFVIDEATYGRLEASRTSAGSPARALPQHLPGRFGTAQGIGPARFCLLGAAL
jgi:hypothetical protein